MHLTALPVTQTPHAPCRRAPAADFYALAVEAACILLAISLLLAVL